MSTPPKPTGTLEAALYAEDLDAAIAFWTRIIGLRLLAHVAGRHAFFWTGNSMLLVFNPKATIQPPPADARLPVPPHGSEGPGHICLSVDAHDFNDWRAHLTRHGIDIEAEFDWPQGGHSIYFRDPAGNSIELADPKIWSAARNNKAGQTR